MTRRDYCRICKELVADNDICCTECGESYCVDCLPDGCKIKQYLEEQNRLYDKLTKRNRFIEKKQRELNLVFISPEERKLFHELEFSTEFWTKEDAKRFNNCGDEEIEELSENYVCFVCDEKKQEQEERQKLTEENTQLKKRVAELELRVDELMRM
jgi:cell division protein FtsB